MRLGVFILIFIASLTKVSAQIPSVNWDRDSQAFRADSMQAVVERVHLGNAGSIDAELTGIWIDGPDADEFSILGTHPYETIVIGSGDTMWVDVKLKLDLTKTPINRRRTAYLRTSTKLDSTRIKTIVLTAGFDLASVQVQENILSAIIHPNPARNKLTVDLEVADPEKVSIVIFDVLGRRVAGRLFSSSIGPNSFTLDLPHNAKGAYSAIIKAGGISKSLHLLIE